MKVSAYPIAYDKTGIYAASGHDMQCFEIDEKNGVLKLAEGIYEQIDENGNSTYTLEKDNETKVITEKEYYTVFEKYASYFVVIRMKCLVLKRCHNIEII